MTPQKRKVTLTVDGPTVDRARQLGINISELTETALKGFSFDPNDVGNRQVSDEYKALFDSMDQLLTVYRAWVEVGQVYDSPGDAELDRGRTLRLGPNGTFRVDPPQVEVAWADIQKDAYWYDPTRILTNLFESLQEAKERRVQDIEKLAMAQRLIQAISGSMLGDARSDSTTKKPAHTGRKAGPARRAR